MSETRIYRTDPYVVSNEAEVIAVTEIDGRAAIACSQSVFFPEGGGQPSDIGTAACNGQVYDVIRAYDESLEDVVWHVVDAPADTFKIGDRLELAIDWDRRFINMQRHLGEHMLSGTFHTLWGGVNKGFHMGEDYITIDIDLDGRMLTDEELDLAEKTVNEAIWADLPVSIIYFDDYEASLAMPVRKQVPHEGRVSVVTVGDEKNPYDCIACCGTHPSSSGQVGLLAIYKHEPNKGMNRIYFDCGSKALAKMKKDSCVLNEIATRNSCSSDTLAAKLEGDEESNNALKAQLAGMSAYIKGVEMERILEAAKLDEAAVVVKECGALRLDDVLKLGFAASEKLAGRLLIIMHPESRTAMLFSSGEYKCGALVKENVGKYNGKGGGRDDNARAVFLSEKDMRSFARGIAEGID